MRLSTYAALICCVFLLGCSSDDSGKGAESSALPYIGKVRAQIAHYHPSYWDHEDEPPHDLDILFEFEVTHPGTVAELDYVNVYSSINDEHWDFLGGPDNIPLSEFYSTGKRMFSDRLVLSDSTARVELKGYEVVVFDRDGNRSIKYFDFPGFHGGALDGKEYVYSPQYDRPTFDGLRAMEAMTIERHDLSFESDPGSQSFTIEFSHRDTRARHYEIAFYGAGPDHQYLGQIKQFNSASIFSTPLIPGRRTRLALPYSEVMDANPNIVDIQEIAGIHIGLTDEFIDGWSFYTGVSEFVTLPVLPSE